MFAALDQGDELTRMKCKSQFYKIDQQESYWSNKIINNDFMGPVKYVSAFFGHFGFVVYNIIFFELIER